MFVRLSVAILLCLGASASILPQTCQKNEVYVRCVPGCRDTCENYKHGCATPFQKLVEHGEKSSEAFLIPNKSSAKELNETEHFVSVIPISVGINPVNLVDPVDPSDLDGTVIQESTLGEVEPVIEPFTKPDSISITTDISIIPIEELLYTPTVIIDDGFEIPQVLPVSQTEPTTEPDFTVKPTDTGPVILNGVSPPIDYPAWIAWAGGPIFCSPGCICKAGYVVHTETGHCIKIKRCHGPKRPSGGSKPQVNQQSIVLGGQSNNNQNAAGQHSIAQSPGKTIHENHPTESGQGDSEVSPTLRRPYPDGEDDYDEDEDEDEDATASSESGSSGNGDQVFVIGGQTNDNVNVLNYQPPRATNNKRKKTKSHDL